MASAFPKLAVVFAGLLVLQVTQVPVVHSRAEASEVALRTTQKSLFPPDSCRRSIVKNENGKWTYRVNSRAHALQLIALDLYGSAKKSYDIARWNKLESPYFLKANDLLVVLEEPRLSEVRANTLLAKSWRVLGNKARAGCVLGKPVDLKISEPAAAANTSDSASLPTPLPTAGSTSQPLPQDDRLGIAAFSNSTEPLQESAPSDDALSKVLGVNSESADDANEDPLLE